MLFKDLKLGLELSLKVYDSPFITPTHGSFLTLKQ